MTIGLLSILSLAAIAIAPGTGTTYRYSLDPVIGPDAGAPLSDESKAREWTLAPLEEWLRDRLPKLCPGVESISFLHTTRRRIGARSDAATTSREIEIKGTTEYRSAAVEAVLAGLAAQATKPVRIHATILECRTEEPASKRGRADVVLLDEWAWRKARLAAEREAETSPETAKILCAPTLAVESGLRASISVGDEIAYLSDFAIRQVGDSVIADPVIETVREGVLLEATPIVHPDGRSVTVELALTIANLVRPIREIETVVAGNAMTRHMPEVRQVEWKSGPIDLALDRAQFAVRGLVGASDRGDLDRQFEVYVMVRVEDAPADRREGTVVAADSALRIVIVEFEASLAAQVSPGDTFGVFREGKIADLVVDGIDGRIAICHTSAGAPPAKGDRVR